MFWIKTIKRLDINQKNQAQISLDLQKQIKECENWIEALKECTIGDRKDITALIQLVKKSTKGKK